MKDLEMNWTKLTPPLKDKVLNIMVDSILNNPKSDYDFKSSLLKKLNIPVNTNTTNTPIPPSTFGHIPRSNFEPGISKSSFGKSESNNSNSIYVVMVISVVCLIILLFIFMRNDKK
jgi:hypothetical protein